MLRVQELPRPQFSTCRFKPSLMVVLCPRDAHDHASLEAHRNSAHNGKVLITGGWDKDAPLALGSAELNYPSTSTFWLALRSRVPAVQPRCFPTAGIDFGGWNAIFPQAEGTRTIYGPSGNAFTPTGSMLPNPYHPTRKRGLTELYAPPEQRSHHRWAVTFGLRL
jgi:hypothetical protein